jgi:redox-sensitive bicupin YhaK (pirin superfamily)
VRVGTGQKLVRQGELGVLGEGSDVTLAGDSSGTTSRAIVVAGKPLHEPVARYGPFVMNTREQLIQAVEDFQKGRF